MNFYCGIDLSARDSHLCVLDDNLAIQLQQKAANELPRLVALLNPFKPNLQIVVESTFNWYWLVDGLGDLGFEVCLAHTLGLAMIPKAKVKTDSRAAFTLAQLRRAGMIPKAYIYPAQTPPLRDLLRRRMQVVQRRAQEYGALRQLLLREGILTSSRNAIKQTADEDLHEWFAHPLVVLQAAQRLARIDLLTRQLAELERTILEPTREPADDQRLLGLPGIGKLLALTILYEVGELARFSNDRHFSSYCRLIPGLAQSGAVSRRGRASKQGNHYLKSAFSQAAVIAVRSYPKIRGCYERQLARHRGSARKLVAYNVIAHKLAQAVFHILKDQTEYREEWLFGT